MRTKWILAMALALLLLAGPAWGVRNPAFATDPDCVALWSFDSTVYPVEPCWLDAIGNNDLEYSGGGSPQIVTVGMREGTGCWDLNAAWSVSSLITDTLLDAGYPLKAGDTNKKISICCWIKPDSIPGTGYMVIYEKASSSKDTFYVILNSTGYMYMGIGISSGTSVEWKADTSTPIQAGQWYHVGVTYQDSDKSYRIRVWDQTARTVKETTGTTTNNVNVEDAGIRIGAHYNNMMCYDGLIDEMVVFKDILTPAEIDAIRAGTYGSPSSIVNQWWWRRRN